MRSPSLYRDVTAQDALVPEIEHAAPLPDELARHPACVPDEQEPPRPEELEMHPFGVHATDAAEPDEEQAEDIAKAPPPDEEEVAAELHPLRAAGGGVQLEIRWHGAEEGVGTQTTGNHEGPYPGAEAQASGPAKDAANRTCWDWSLDFDVATAGPDTVVAPRAATASIILAVRARRPAL